MKGTLRRILPERTVLRLQAWDYRRSGPPEFRHLRRLCRPDKSSLDIGANVGVFTWEMLRHSQRVVAYEPNPALATRLERLFDERVRIVAAALSSRAGTATLSIPQQGGAERHELASIAQDFDGAERVERVEVPLRRLDDEGHRNVGFVKIDVEQHELEVIRGGMELIRRERPSLLVEVTPLLYGRPLPEVFAPLLDLGYRARFFFDGRLHELAAYDPALHNSAANEGNADRYVTNLLFTLPER